MVYLIKEGRRKRTKVGVTDDLGTLIRRLQNLQTGNSERLEIYCVFPGYGYELERKILLEYRHRGLSCDGGGEWVKATAPSVARYVATLTKGD